MTKEEKSLLFKDLCGRLPYRIKCSFISSKGNIPSTIVKIDVESETVCHKPDGQSNVYFHWIESGYIKPYLRPLSSMTEAEQQQLDSVDALSRRIFFDDLYGRVEKDGRENLKGFLPDYPTLDWLNEHHFDYRGLIEKGLALKAPENMYR